MANPDENDPRGGSFSTGASRQTADAAKASASKAKASSSSSASKSKSTPSSSSSASKTKSMPSGEGSAKKTQPSSSRTKSMPSGEGSAKKTQQVSSSPNKPKSISSGEGRKTTVSGGVSPGGGRTGKPGDMSQTEAMAAQAALAQMPVNRGLASMLGMPTGGTQPPGQLARDALLGKRQFGQSALGFTNAPLEVPAPPMPAQQPVDFYEQFMGTMDPANTYTPEEIEAFTSPFSPFPDMLPGMPNTAVPVPGPMQGPAYPGPVQGPSFPGPVQGPSYPGPVQGPSYAPPIQGPTLPQPTPRPFEPDMSQYSPTVPPGDVISATSPLGTPEAAAAAAQARAAYEEMQQRVMQESLPSVAPLPSMADAQRMMEINNPVQPTFTGDMAQAVFDNAFPNIRRNSMAARAAAAAAQSPGPVQGPVQGTPAPLPSMADAQRMMELNNPVEPTFTDSMHQSVYDNVRTNREQNSMAARAAAEPGPVQGPSFPGPVQGPSFPGPVQGPSFPGPVQGPTLPQVSPYLAQQFENQAMQGDANRQMLPGMSPMEMDEILQGAPVVQSDPTPAPAPATQPVVQPLPSFDLNEAPRPQQTTTTQPAAMPAQQIAADTGKTQQDVPAAVALPGVGPMIGGIQGALQAVGDAITGGRQIFGEDGIIPPSDPYTIDDFMADQRESDRGSDREQQAADDAEGDADNGYQRVLDKLGKGGGGYTVPVQQQVNAPYIPPTAVAQTPQTPTPTYRSYNDLMAAAEAGYPMTMAGGGMVRPSMTNAFTPGSYYAMYDPRKRGLGGM